MNSILLKFKNSFTEGGRLPIMNALMAYGSAQLFERLVRLIVVIIIARQLAPELVGVAALTLTIFELTRVLANIGVGQKIIAATTDDFEKICNSAHKIFWIWCPLVALFQCIIAIGLYTIFNQTLSALMLAVLSFVYFLMPGGLVQCFRLMRAKKMVVCAKIQAIQTISDHILTCVMLLIWVSPWSIVLPKLLTAPIWLLMMRYYEKWSPDKSHGVMQINSMVRFGVSVLITDSLITIRSQVDKLIIGATLGISALGTYYFAFNAGIGIVSALITAFTTVIYPHLCDGSSKHEHIQKMKLAIGAGLGLFGCAALAQYTLAPYYVPVIFGEKWSHAIGLIQILSLASIPMACLALTTAWLRATDRANVDALAGLITSSCALGGMAIGAQFGLSMAAMAWVGGTLFIAIPFSFYIFSPLFRSRSIKIQLGVS